MENLENKLLDLIKILIGEQKVKNIEEGLKNLLDNKKDEDLINFINEILLNIIEENRIIKEELLGFKDLICKILIGILNNKEYNNAIEKFLEVEDEQFVKIMFISILISNKIKMPVFNTLFSILSDNKFDFLKEKLEAINIKNITKNTDFLYIINRYDINTLYNDAFNSNTIDLSKTLYFDNEDIRKYIEKIENHNEEINSKNEDNYINKINENNQEDLESKNQENKITNEYIKNEEINNNIINNNENILFDEKKNRIVKLISSSIKIKCNKNLKEHKFLELNYQKMINNNNMKSDDDIIVDDIIVDDYDCKDEKKLYLYSPISLLINNIKNKFEKNDFEIFNNDNFYIELFGNYLENIIQKLNNFIIYGYEENYLKENKVKFGCYGNRYYLCCKIDEKFREDYFESKIINQNRYKINENNLIEVIKVPKKEKGNKKQLKPEEEKIDNPTEYKSKISNSSISKDNSINKMSNNFENQVNDFIFREDCEALQNIIFFFNLKIPKIINNNINLQSVRLSFSQFNENYLYGFREIDICFKNKNKRSLESTILSNNICYEFIGGKLEHKKNQEIDVYLKEDSIIFCEVKNSFPEVSYGSELYSKLNVVGNYGNDNCYTTFSFLDHLDNLIKKAKIFYYFFKDEKLIKKNQYMHILYLYDLCNISFDEEYKEIKTKIEDYIKNLRLPNDFKNVIIQVAYFDKDKNIKEKEEKIINENKKLKENNKSKDEEIKAKEEEIKKLKVLLDKYNINYQ